MPLEAALSASRRVVAIASTFALARRRLCWCLLGAIDLLPAPSAERADAALAALGIVSAALYAAGLALGAEALARTSFWLLYAEEDRYRLLARNMTDVITRHGRDGAVLFVSPAAQSLFGCGVADLHGHGLFESRPCRRPSGLSDRARRCRGARARAVPSSSASAATAPMPTAAATRNSSGSRCAAGRSNSRRRAGRSDRREVVAVLRDVTERKRAGAGARTTRAPRPSAPTPPKAASSPP